MKSQRWTAVGMIVNQTVAYSVMSDSNWFSAIITTAAFTGVWGLINFKPGAVMKYSLLLILATGAGIMTVFSTYSYPVTLVPYFNSVLIYFAVHFLLMRQVVELFISANSRLSKDQPVYGIIVLVFIGSVQTGITQNRIFLICSIGFIISAALFTSCSLAAYKKKSKGYEFKQVPVIYFNHTVWNCCSADLAKWNTPYKHR